MNASRIGVWVAALSVSVIVLLTAASRALAQDAVPAPVGGSPSTPPEAVEPPTGAVGGTASPTVEERPVRVMGLLPHRTRARLVPRGRHRGLAVSPREAPPEVRDVIAAANRIARRPYAWGGGHASFDSRGYDCSGSVSYALHGGDLLDSPLPSYGFFRYGRPGPGRWATIYTRSSHMYMVVAGLRFDTTGRDATGSRWQTARRSTAGFVARHPRGL